MKSTIQHIRSKSKKTSVLLKHPKLSLNVPATKPLSKQSLRTMLHRYRMVYVKPDRGRFGIGVMRVEKISRRGQTNYRYQLGLKVKQFDSYDQLFRSILKHTSSRKYIAQKGIYLLRHRKRPFDIRIMVQLNPKKRWETTGAVARVASPNRVVTNYHNHGHPVPLGPLLVPYFGMKKRKAYEGRLNHLGARIAKHLHIFYPKIKEIGVDIGIDNHLKPWILEVNTRPDPYIFKQLRDKRMFRKIYRYARAYGKYKK
jgi:hypothetical protein